MSKQELKLRVWDGARMWYTDQSVEEGKFEITFNNEGIWCNTWEPDGTYIGTVEAEEVMLFTGLKDKNGRDIYDGEIMDHGDEKLLVVEWNAMQHRWSLYTNVGRAGNCRCHLGEGMSDYTILGNAYENPELLLPL